MSLLSLEVEGAVIHVQSTTQDFSSVTLYENLSTYGVSTDKLVNATVMLTNCVVDNKQTIKAKDYYHNLLDVIPYSEHNSTWKRRLYNHVNLSKQIQ